MSDKKIAIVGATGAVGQVALKTLEKSSVNTDNIRLFASKRSSGKVLTYKGRGIEVEELTHDSFKGIDIAIFSIGADLSLEYAPSAVKDGCIVIDNSSAFRMYEEIPLVIPEINPLDIYKHNGIIANPNCTTIITLMAVYPIYKLSRIKQMTVSSYQAVSGAGIKAIDELYSQLRSILDGNKPSKNVFQHQIAMNVFSHDSKILENGFNKEEQKLIDESRKILGDGKMLVNPTCVRVPVLRSHSVSVSLITNEYLNFDDIKKSIEIFDGTNIIDDREANRFPMPIDTSDTYDIAVGRLRRGNTHENEIMLFACGDQLLKGAALNAVQIAELIV